MEKKFDMEQARALASSPAARQLFELLNRQGADVRQAARQAAAGDPAPAQAILAQLLADEQGKALLAQLQGEYHG